MVFNWILMEMRFIRQTNDGPSVACSSSLVVFKFIFIVYMIPSTPSVKYRFHSKLSFQNFRNCILSDSLNFDAIIYQLELFWAGSVLCVFVYGSFLLLSFQFSNFRSNFVGCDKKYRIISTWINSTICWSAM